MEETLKAEDLLLAVSKMDFPQFTKMINENKSKKSLFTFKIAVKNLKVEEMDRMWDDLCQEITKCFEEMFISNNSPSKKKCLDPPSVIQIATDLAFAMFEQNLPVPQGLLRIAILFNHAILKVPGTFENLKNGMALVCEKMFLMNYLYQNQEQIISNIVIYLIQRSLTPKPKKTIVKRIYALRSLITTLCNTKDVDVQDLLTLAKRCAVAPVYLSMIEGQKLISLMLTWHIDYIPEIHEVIKQKLPTCSENQAIAYGKMYLDAWNRAVKMNLDDLKNEIEQTCLQDLVLLLVRSSQKSLVSNLRKLLAQFHSQKKEHHVAKMLFSIYDPIFWRYLKDPKGLVRANTAQLFLDVFPLDDPDIKLVTANMALNDQMIIIKDLLVDEFPIVRSATVLGLCYAITLNWTLFPEDMLKTYFKIMVNDLSCDSASADVRCAVAQGFKMLLETPLAIPTMQAILPKVNKLFHDVSDIVRVHFCNLLLRVKRISAIKYYEVVPLDDLLNRLAADPEDKATGKLIVNLIYNSYFPKTKGPEVWLARCIELIRMDEAASQRFFTHVIHFVEVEALAQFMVQTVKSIHHYIRSKANASRVCPLSLSQSLMCDKENEEESEDLGKCQIVRGLLGGVAILWMTTVHQLEQSENKILLKMVVSKLTKCLADMSLYYKDTDAWGSVYYLSSLMPSISIPSLSSLCFLRLKALLPTATPEEYTTLLECLLNQDEGGNVLMLVKEWITAGFNQTVKSPVPKKRKTKRSSTGAPQQPEEAVVAPIVAVRILSSLLDHRTLQKIVLTKHVDDLKDCLKFTDDTQRKVEMCIDENIVKEEAQFCTELLFALLKIAVILHAEEKMNGIKFVEEVIVWFQDKILKNEMNTTMNTSRRSSKKLNVSPAYKQLCEAVSKDLCTLMTDMILLGYFNVKSLKFLKFSIKLLSTVIRNKLLLNVMRLLFRHVSYGIYALKVGEGGCEILKMVPDCFSKIFQCLEDEELFQNIPKADVKEIHHLFAETIQAMRPVTDCQELVSSIMSTMSKTILNNMISDMEVWEEIEKNCDSFELITISPTADFLLTALGVKPKLMAYFLLQLKGYLKQKGKDIKLWVSCYVLILHTWNIKHVVKYTSKELSSLVQEMENLLVEEHQPLSPVDTNVQLKRLSLCDKNADKEIISFEEHCKSQYQKLKDVMSEKVNIPSKKPAKQ